MNATNTGSNSKRIISILLLVLALVALYYLYKYLFTASGLVVNEINGTIIPSQPKSSTAQALYKEYPTVPVVYTGGEMTVSSWIYVSDWQNVRNGSSKHILSVGKKVKTTATTDDQKEQTLVMYLDKFKNNLNVVVSCSSDGTTAGSSYKVTKTDVKGQFATSSSNALDGKKGRVVVKDIELQKWILLTVCLNNKVLDVYMDGKLIKSTVLPTMFSVDPARADSLEIQLGGYGGFGGFFGRAYMSNYAMNPEEIWKTYMSGPGDQPSIGDYISSLFDPNTYKGIKFPTLQFQ